MLGWFCFVNFLLILFAICLGLLVRLSFVGWGLVLVVCGWAVFELCLLVGVFWLIDLILIFLLWLGWLKCDLWFEYFVICLTVVFGVL